MLTMIPHSFVTRWDEASLHSALHAVYLCKYFLEHISAGGSEEVVFGSQLLGMSPRMKDEEDTCFKSLNISVRSLNVYSLFFFLNAHSMSAQVNQMHFPYRWRKLKVWQLVSDFDWMFECFLNFQYSIKWFNLLQKSRLPESVSINLVYFVFAIEKLDRQNSI